MAQKIDRAVIDTYALIADITGQATPNATRTLESVRTGKIKGIIPFLIVYELAYHWKKRHILAFLSNHFYLNIHSSA
ncbi:MAG: hypothetical protein J7K82_04495, partial [Thermoproteales archaeon]|nr:hypothetical protein [Thermoproteales archaeon]